MRPTPENLSRAKSFLLERWKERWRERKGVADSPTEPENLSDACKFAALFARELFGGTIQANYNHCWVELRDGTVIDLTDGVDADLYDCTPEEFIEADPDFMDDVVDGDRVPNEEFWDSLESCLPRVKKWVADFRRTHT
jgi:hypothetical protein